MNNDNKDIKDFWAIDQSLLSKDTLKEYVKEYFKEDFINNYVVWKKRINSFDDALIQDLITFGIKKEFYEPMTFDYFCKSIIDNLCEIVDVRKKIISEDIVIVIEKVGMDYMNIINKKYKESINTVSNLIETIKIAKGYFYDVK